MALQNVDQVPSLRALAGKEKEASMMGLCPRTVFWCRPTGSCHEAFLTSLSRIT